jgi:hypothetical protein
MSSCFNIALWLFGQEHFWTQRVTTVVMLLNPDPGHGLFFFTVCYRNYFLRYCYIVDHVGGVSRYNEIFVPTRVKPDKKTKWESLRNTASYKGMKVHKTAFVTVMHMCVFINIMQSRAF